MANKNPILKSDVDSSLGASHQNQPEIDVNPNQRLSYVLLNEFNYLPWSRAVSLALEGRSKLGFINGSIESPNVSSTTYESWLSKDQLVMSWLLNSMERKIAEIFSYSESSFQLWKSVQEMYGNQNNAARVFQLKKDIASIQQDGKPFVQLLGSLKGMWNELEAYRPHTTDSNLLPKRAEEDKIFQLLSSLGSDYEDLRSHIIMNPEIPTFANVCVTIQREKVRKKVMNTGTSTTSSEVRAYFSSEKKHFSSDKKYKGRNPHLKYKHCDATGHVRDNCWILHPELKPDFMKNERFIQKKPQFPSYKANHTSSLSTRGS
ncbi:hypothetical protein COP2_044953 [Malus domestica]